MTHFNIYFHQILQLINHKIINHENPSKNLNKQSRTWCKPKVMMKWNETRLKTWQFPGPIMLALLGGSQETLLRRKLTTPFHQCSESRVCSHRHVTVDLSNSNLRKRLQVLGSAASFYSYILLFHFCLLINRSRLLITPLQGHTP